MLAAGRSQRQQQQCVVRPMRCRGAADSTVAFNEELMVVVVVVGWWVEAASCHGTHHYSALHNHVHLRRLHSVLMLLLLLPPLPWTAADAAALALDCCCRCFGLRGGSATHIETHLM